MTTRKPRSPEWHIERQIERSRLVYQRAALDAAQNANEKEADTLLVQADGLRARVDRLSSMLKQAELERDEGMRVYDESLERREHTRETAMRVDRLLEGFDISGFPLQDCPTDILRLIFLEAAADQPKFRWTAMAVCRDWRVLVQTTPRLWTSVTVDFAAQEDAFVEITRDALGYGGQAPLELTLLFSRPKSFWTREMPSATGPVVTQVAGPAWGAAIPPAANNVPNTPDPWHGAAHGHPPPFHPKFEFVQDYIDIIISHLSRCRTLTWKLPSSEALNPAMAYSGMTWSSTYIWEARWLSRKLGATAISNLKTLALEFVDGWSTGVVDRQDLSVVASRVCAACPSLTQLTMRHVTVPSLVSRGLISLDLSICTIPWDDLLHLLSEQMCLRSLRLHNVDMEAHPWGIATPLKGGHPTFVILPSLERFQHNSTYWPGWSLADHLLDRLQCPNLKRAILLGVPPAESIPATVAFLLRSPFLEQVAFSIDQPRLLEPVLQSLMFAREFVGVSWPRQGVHRYTVTPDLVDALSSPGVLPALQRLQLLGVDDAEDRLGPWIKARREANPLLLSVRVNGRGTVPLDLASGEGMALRTKLSDEEIEWAGSVEWPFEANVGIPYP